LKQRLLIAVEGEARMSVKRLFVLLVALTMVAAFLVAACGNNESDPNLKTGDDDDDDNNDDTGDAVDDDASPDTPDYTCVAAYNQIYTVCDMSFPDFTLDEMIAGNCYGSGDPIFGVDGAIVHCYMVDPTCEPLIACVSALFE
jgi:hypothetical protein